MFWVLDKCKPTFAELCCIEYVRPLKVCFHIKDKIDVKQKMSIYGLKDLTLKKDIHFCNFQVITIFHAHKLLQAGQIQRAQQSLMHDYSMTTSRQKKRSRHTGYS